MLGRRSMPPICGQGGLDGQMGQQLSALLPVTSISYYASQNVNLSWNCHEKCISWGSDPECAAVRRSTWVLLHPSLGFGPSVPPRSSFFSSCGTVRAGLLVSLILFSTTLSFQWILFPRFFVVRLPLSYYEGRHLHLSVCLSVFLSVSTHPIYFTLGRFVALHHIMTDNKIQGETTIHTGRYVNNQAILLFNPFTLVVRNNMDPQHKAALASANGELRYIRPIWPLKESYCAWCYNVWLCIRLQCLVNESK